MMGIWHYHINLLCIRRKLSGRMLWNVSQLNVMYKLFKWENEKKGSEMEIIWLQMKGIDSVTYDGFFFPIWLSMFQSILNEETKKKNIDFISKKERKKNERNVNDNMYNRPYRKYTTNCMDVFFSFFVVRLCLFLFVDRRKKINKFGMNNIVDRKKETKKNVEKKI